MIQQVEELASEVDVILIGTIQPFSEGPIQGQGRGHSHNVIAHSSKYQPGGRVNRSWHRESGWIQHALRRIQAGIDWHSGHKVWTLCEIKIAGVFAGCDIEGQSCGSSENS